MCTLVDPWKGKRGFGGDIFWAYLVEIALSGILTCHHRPVKVTREPLFLHDQTNNNGQDVDVDENFDLVNYLLLSFGTHCRQISVCISETFCP